LSKIFGLAVTVLILAGMTARWRLTGGGLQTIYGWLAAACLLILAVVLVAFAMQNFF
jgi:hypothetical protein